MMEQHKKRLPAVFSSRKVSPDQAVNLLRRNGIQVNEEQAAIILDFLYLLARTYSKVAEYEAAESAI
ncbi:hypothetical protein SAMN05216490_4731 [Mucilaginibacter mallensis]|uniref:Uncharacterized protein n=1 Tax=Mucilaginibacter mallensis TaxID=652787 RepID=A0A1H2C8Q8_MUCMA|nr:hypothetical protein [Mucilaginibacter mallensis]SDT66771.1 hypothetical protein SAMN05216490_4731 [Mucilaginibacter mallensis]